MGTRVAGVATAVVAIVAIVAIVGTAYWLGGRGGQSPIGAAASPTPQTTITAQVSPTASPEVTIGATPSPASVPSGTRLCLPPSVSARITTWEGAAGSRIATVKLQNVAPTDCLWPTLDQPQLVDGSGAILIDGAVAPAGTVLTLAPGDVVTALVRDSNYCRQAPVAPVTVAFVLPGGTGRVVAAPVSATDSSGVPPCNGAAGSPGKIEMQPWAR